MFKGKSVYMAIISTSTRVHKVNACGSRCSTVNVEEGTEITLLSVASVPTARKAARRGTKVKGGTAFQREPRTTFDQASAARVFIFQHAGHVVLLFLSHPEMVQQSLVEHVVLNGLNFFPHGSFHHNESIVCYCRHGNGNIRNSRYIIDF